MLRLGVQLDAPVCVVVDPVVANHGIAALGDVDAVVLVGRGKRPAIVDPVLLDYHSPGRGVRVIRRNRDADRRVLIRDLVAAQGHPIGVDPGPDVGACAVEHQALDRRAHTPGQHRDLAPQAHRFADRGGEGEVGLGQAELREPIGAPAEAAGLARVERLDQPLGRAKRVRPRPGPCIRAPQRRVAVAGHPDRRADTGLGGSRRGMTTATHRECRDQQQQHKARQGGEGIHRLAIGFPLPSMSKPCRASASIAVRCRT